MVFFVGHSMACAAKPIDAQRPAVIDVMRFKLAMLQSAKIATRRAFQPSFFQSFGYFTAGQRLHFEFYALVVVDSV